MNQGIEYRLGLYEKAMPNHLSLLRKLETAKRCGYDYAELSIDETDEKLARLDMDPKQRSVLREQSAALGISFESICLSAHRKYPIGSSDPLVRARGMEIMKKAVLLAADLGIRIIQIAGYDVYYETSTPETRRLFAEQLSRCVEWASLYGVVLAFETMETEFLNTVHKAMNWIERMQCPYLGVYPDSGNITNAAKLYGTNEFEDLMSGRGHLVALHLKETVPGKFRNIPYGEGHVDFRQMVRTGYKLGIRRYLAEFWYKENSDCESSLKQANQFLRNCFTAISD